MEFLDSNLNYAISKWYEARAFAKSSKAETIIDMKVPTAGTIADALGTAPLYKWMWNNVSSFHNFFKSYRIEFDELMNNVYMSRLLMLWDFDNAYLQYVCIVFDEVSVQGLRLSRPLDKPMYWFCQSVKTICQELFRYKRMCIVPCKDYRPEARYFIADVRCDLDRWKRWRIVHAVDDTSSRSRETTERSSGSKRHRDSSPDRQTSSKKLPPPPPPPLLPDHKTDLQMFQNILREKLKQSNDKIDLIKKLTVALVQM